MTKKSTQQNKNNAAVAIAILVIMIIGLAVSAPFIHTDFGHGMIVGGLFACAVACGLVAAITKK